MPVRIAGRPVLYPSASITTAVATMLPESVARRPIRSVSRPATSCEISEPTPKRVIARPATATEKPRAWVRYTPVNGMTMVPSRLTSVPAQSAQKGRGSLSRSCAGSAVIVTGYSVGSCGAGWRTS
jgi:hypothetical protein